MKRVEAMLNGRIVAIDASWKPSDPGACFECARIWRRENLDFDSVRAREAANIYDALGIEV